MSLSSKRQIKYSWASWQEGTESLKNCPCTSSEISALKAVFCHWFAQSEEVHNVGT